MDEADRFEEFVSRAGEELALYAILLSAARAFILAEYSAEGPDRPLTLDTAAHLMAKFVIANQKEQRYAS